MSSNLQKWRAVYKQLYYLPWLQKCSLCQETRSFFLEQSAKCVFGRRINCIQAQCQPPTPPQWWHWLSVESCVHERTVDMENCLVCYCWWGQARQQLTPPQRLVIRMGYRVKNRRKHLGDLRCWQSGDILLWQHAGGDDRLGKTLHLFHAGKPQLWIWNHPFSHFYLNFNTWLILLLLWKLLCHVKY